LKELTKSFVVFQLAKAYSVVSRRAAKVLWCTWKGWPKGFCGLEGLGQHFSCTWKGRPKIFCCSWIGLAKKILLCLEKGWPKIFYYTWKGWPKVFCYTWKGWPKDILLYLERLAKSDVVLQRGVLHPGLLGHIGHLALDIDLTGHAHPLHVPNEGGEKRGLARSHLSHNRHQFAPLHFQLYPLK
jgi:hypothetical protein